ncbi:hypothetical protein AGMMS49983_15020 [Clostridia bacterium]|nr:hypothetical protein AGMMS49983_15020 [Clostridia bacterium]
MSQFSVVPDHTPLFHLGFFAKDAKAFAQAHHDLYGSGPFIVNENIDMKYTFRGKETTTNLTIVTGGWKDILIEIIQQNGEGESYLNEDGHPYGFHHIAFGVSDVHEAIKEFEAAGNTVQFYNFDRPNFPLCYIDARATSGYYIELNPEMDGLSQVVKKWAADWDGETKLFRTMADLRG